MIEQHTRQEQVLNERLLKRYKEVAGDACMASIAYKGEAPADPCEGKIGKRHAIAKNHLRLITVSGDRIRANKAIASFDKFAERYDRLQRVPIRQFSAGNWSCQKHDERFAGIDAPRIDLANLENLFNAVYRAAARHNHLAMARWMAVDDAMKTTEGRKIFRETAFVNPVSEGKAAQVLYDWRTFATALMSNMRDLERRLQHKKWDSLEYRAVLLASRPVVAGWGCQAMRFDLQNLPPDDPRHGWKDFIDFAYMVVIPQRDGHAIITACEPEGRFRVEEITCIHDSIPLGVIHNDAYHASEAVRRRISNKIWGLNELGLNEALYQSWSNKDQRRVQYWMRQDRTDLLTDPEKAPDYLPPILQ